MSEVFDLDIEQQVFRGLVLGRVNTILHLHGLIEVFPSTRRQHLVEHAIFVGEVGVEPLFEFMEQLGHFAALFQGASWILNAVVLLDITLVDYFLLRLCRPPVLVHQDLFELSLAGWLVKILSVEGMVTFILETNVDAAALVPFWLNNRRY